MWVKKQVEVHEIIHAVTGQHVWPDTGKRGLGVASPLFGCEGAGRRHVPDRRVQGHVVGRNQRDASMHDLVR